MSKILHRLIMLTCQRRGKEVKNLQNCGNVVYGCPLVQPTSLLQRQLQRLPQLHIPPLQPLHLLLQLLILRLQSNQPHMPHLHLPHIQFTPRRLRLNRPTNNPTHQHQNTMLTITLPYEFSRALNFTLNCRFSHLGPFINQGGGGFAKRRSYLISLFSKSDVEGGRGGQKS